MGDVSGPRIRSLQGPVCPGGRSRACSLETRTSLPQSEAGRSGGGFTSAGMSPGGYRAHTSRLSWNEEPGLNRVQAPNLCHFRNTRTRFLMTRETGCHDTEREKRAVESRAADSSASSGPPPHRPARDGRWRGRAGSAAASHSAGLRVISASSSAAGSTCLTMST